MTSCSLLTVAALLGPAALLALGCGAARITDAGGTDTGSTSADDGGTGSGGGASSSGGSSSTDTGTPLPPCGGVQLADIAAGIGGFVIDGERARDGSGFSVSQAGDVDGDGLADLIVGAPYADPPEYGRAYVVFGKTDTGSVSLADVAQGAGGFVMTGGAELDEAGHSVSGAGDVNGDGLADVIVGAHGANPNASNDAGSAYVVFGRADTAAVPLVALGAGGFAIDGEADLDRAGSSVSAAGDVNGDGLADVIVGARRASPNDVHWAGRTYVVFGKADSDAVQLGNVALGIGGFALDGEAEEDYSGSSVSGAGDVNGDGLADVIVGVDSPGGTGRIYVVFGKDDTEAVSLEDVVQGIGGFVLVGEPGGLSSVSVSAAGDVDADGLDDVIVGAPRVDATEHSSGRTYAVFGKEDTGAIMLWDVAQESGGFAMDGEGWNHQSGRSVSGAGDIDRDGLDDVIIGAWQADPNGLASCGRSYVVFGKMDTDGVLLADAAQGIGGFALDGEAEEDVSGLSVSGAGDVNADGIPDLVVGAYRASPNELDESGRTYVVFGGDFSCGGE